MDNIVKKDTSGICVKCGSRVPASVLIRDGKVLMKKNCPTHGEDISIIEKDAGLYLKLYHKDPDSDHFPPSKRNLLISVEHRCDLSCFFCCAPHRDKQNISLEKFREKVENYPGSEITLTGGEPTLRKDLIDLIKIVKAAGKKCILTTNGIRLADPAFARELKLSGVDIVFLSIYSLNPVIDAKFCGSNVLEQKLKALENIKSAGIALAISAAILPNGNELEFERIFRLAVDNDARFISIRAIARVGKNEGEKKKLYLSDMITLVSRALNKDATEMIKDRNARRSSPYFIHSQLLVDKATYLNEPWVPGNRFSFYKARIRLAFKVAAAKVSLRGLGSLFDNSRTLTIPLRIASWADVYDYDLNEMAYCKYEWLYDDNEIKNMFEAIILNEGL